MDTQDPQGLGPYPDPRQRPVDAGTGPAGDAIALGVHNSPARNIERGSGHGSAMSLLRGQVGPAFYVLCLPTGAAVAAAAPI